MSSSTNTYVVVIYHNGRQFEGPNGVRFEGKTKTLRMIRGITYNELKERIHRKLGLQGSQCIHRLIARLETLVDKDTICYIGTDINDDEDLECVIDAFDVRKFQQFIELYVEVDDGQCSSLPMHTSTVQYSGEENRNVGCSAPAQIPTLWEDEEDEEDKECEEEDGDEEEEPESVIPAGEASDTDVEGDFDAAPDVVNLSSSSMSPLHVDPISSDVGGVIEPFWNENPHYTSINWDQPDDEMEMLYGEDDLHGGWNLGDPLYVQQEFRSKSDMQHAVKLFCMKGRRTAIVAKSDEHRFAPSPSPSASSPSSPSEEDSSTAAAG